MNINMQPPPTPVTHAFSPEMGGLVALRRPSPSFWAFLFFTPSSFLPQ